MGSTPSKEDLMIKTIESQDINAIQTLIKDLTPEAMHIMCKSLVPGHKNQFTTLHYVVWQDNPELLELFLDYTDDLEIRDSLGWTPLMTAINRGSKENVKKLLKRGSNINCDSMNGRDLIAIAMSFNDLEFIQILLDHGAQTTISSNTYIDNKNSFQCYLLHFAVDDGLTDIARLLIEKGKIPVDTINHTGWTPLHLAAGHNHLDIVKLLLEHGADINIKDDLGNTPLAWAKERNATEVIDELKNHGAIADENWHGEKLKLHNDEKHGIDNHQFEIEDSIETKSHISDALQRQ